MLDLLLTQNHKVKLLNMELTKKEMKLSIIALNKLKEGWDGVNEEFVKDLDLLITKFKTYLNGGENNG